MLFNSYEFIFLFLPIALLGYYLLLRKNTMAPAMGFLIAASLFFYGWWNAAYLLIIIASIIVNYGLSLLLSRFKGGAERPC
ncbi:hypothetical protein [Oceanicoccus sagamiensis]|uniref:hypothetical protein n=1 Tax=Oceanicoccus sagamiensis TaxID=716816 RepID=UPI0012F49408|nr:hypothetical protein [Oceanicoccus sagamiensis]